MTIDTTNPTSEFEPFYNLTWNEQKETVVGCVFNGEIGCEGCILRGCCEAKE